MKFIHIADLHLGARPEAGEAYTQKRPEELWESVYRIIQKCNEDEIDLLLVAGDVFHHQPMLRELKELDYLFSKLVKTHVVLIAGNHDYIKGDSFYKKFQWQSHVHFILNGEMSKLKLKDISTNVFGLSYQTRNIEKDMLAYYEPKKDGNNILLLHGGEEKYLPVNKQKLASLNYDYIALGHIHKPMILAENKMAYAGALEPIDRNDIGEHGYIFGEIKNQKTKIRFCSFAKRSYVPLKLEVDVNETAAQVKDKLSERIQEGGIDNIYKVTLVGFREADMYYDITAFDHFKNIVQITDETKPYYDFKKIMEKNKDNIIGLFIKELIDCEEGSMEYEALYQGVDALMTTRRNEA